MKRINCIILILYLLILFSFNNHAQNKKLDSLWQVFKKAKEDTTRIKLFLSIGELFENTSYDSAIYYYEKALNLSQKTNSKKFEETVLLYIGNVLSDHSEFEQAMEYYMKSLIIAEELGDKNERACCYNYIGTMHQKLDDFDKAIDYYQNSLTIEKELGDKKGVFNCFNNLGNVNKNKGDYGEALKYYLESFMIAIELDDKNGISNCSFNIGTAYLYQGDYNEASNYFHESLNIIEESGDKVRMSAFYNNIGNSYMDQEEYDIAIGYYQKSLNIAEELGLKSQLKGLYMNIGIIKLHQGAYNKAIEYYQKSLKVAQELGDKIGIASCYLNVGNVFSNKKDYDKSLEYHQKSLKIAQETGDKKGIANCYLNLGNVYSDKKDYNKSLEYYQKSLNIAEELKDEKGIIIIYNDIAALNYVFKKFNKAINYAHNGLEIAKEIGDVPIENNIYNFLSYACDSLGNTKKAFEYFKLYAETKDRLFKIEKDKEIIKIKSMYKVENLDHKIIKLKNEKALNNKKIELSDLRIKMKNKIISLFIISFILIIIFFIILYRQNSAKKRANKLLVIQNIEIQQKNEEIVTQSEEITTQRDQLFQQQKDLTDSLEYASLIQHTLLSSEDILRCNFPDYFIIYKPRDIISGDFYWFKQIKNFLFVVIADCTGHGVPGAFMSVLGISLLNDIVGKRGLDPPAEILNELRKRIKNSLKQDNPETINQDGMDIAFCCIDLETLKMQYSGAYNPLYVIRNGELIEYKANHIPVGVHPHDNESFTNSLLQLQKGDAFYIFSDGFTSQFGGPEGKKFNSKPFKELIYGIQNLSMSVQKLSFETTLSGWKGMYPQVDDISILGVRI